MAIKITPKSGAPYYIVDPDGDSGIRDASRRYRYRCQTEQLEGARVVITPDREGQFGCDLGHLRRVNYAASRRHRVL